MTYIIHIFSLFLLFLSVQIRDKIDSIQNIGDEDLPLLKKQKNLTPNKHSTLWKQHYGKCAENYRTSSYL